MRLATIGVYGFDAERFLEALAGKRIGVLIDVRQRRGVRGREYAWANSKRLQAALVGAGVEYRHMKELAPTTELRRIQYREDERRGEGKRARTVLAPEFARRYEREILAQADLSPITELAAEGRRPALLCVERDPEACHRSLIAERLEREHGLAVEHIRPTS
jgi:uncharacterized protein (DUF488 family)